MASIDELKRLARKHQQKVDQELDIPGVIVDSSDLPVGKVRVWRPDVRQTTVVDGTVRTPNLDVLMRYKRGGRLQITGTNVPLAAQTFGAAVGAAEQPPISGEASGTVWGSKNLKPGLLRAWSEGGNGLNAFVDPVTYRDKVITGAVDVSASVPSSVGERRLAVIVYDVSDADFVVIDGTATTSAAPFSLEDYVAIALTDTDQIRLGAVELAYGQTTILTSNNFIQERDWLTLHRAGTVGDAVDVTYDPTASGLTATDVQAAIDEIAAVVAGGSLGAFIHLQDQQTQNTAGGTFTSGSWVTRVLNTEVVDTGGHCTLSSNQFALDAGTYRITATAPVYNVGRNRLRLQNITDTATELLGQNQYANAPGMLTGRFTIAATKTFELQHRCEVTSATYGLGTESNWAMEIYADVQLWKE